MPRRGGATVALNHVEVAVGGADRRWCAIYYRSEPRAHFLPYEDDVPICRRRRGAKGTPIKHNVFSGVGLMDLRGMAWGNQAIRGECLARFSEEGKTLLLA
eukprot:10294630-Heterocapsa_arctica.AAC.1